MTEDGAALGGGEVPRAEDRDRWLDPTEWRRFDRYTTATYNGAQLRVDTYRSRKGAPRVRVWAQVWRPTDPGEGAPDFVPTEIVFAFDSDLTRLAEKLLKEQRGWRAILDRLLYRLLRRR